MPSVFKLVVYRAARALGLFALARRATRGQLRILAYHGFADGDALQFRPKLFISGAAFERRMQALRRRHLHVLTLDEAVTRLREGRPCGDAVVITIDDGYASTLSLAAPVLQRHGFPATVYVTTYHVLKQTPVFDLVLAYLLWKCPAPEVVWDWPDDRTLQRLDLSSPAQREAAAACLIAHGHRLDGEPARVAMCRALAAALGVSYDELCSDEAFRLMTPDELRRIAAAGIDVALHTHRHRFPPDDLGVCRQELLENQALLAEMTGRRSAHFCYPSGVYDQRQWPLLEELGVLSATTCDTGAVGVGDPPYGLRRVLDGEMVTDIEFDAEICGFAELLRGVRRLSGGRSE